MRDFKVVPVLYISVLVIEKSHLRNTKIFS